MGTEGEAKTKRCVVVHTRTPTRARPATVLAFITGRPDNGIGSRAHTLDMKACIVRSCSRTPLFSLGRIVVDCSMTYVKYHTSCGDCL